jgi:hypothetical protein
MLTLRYYLGNKVICYIGNPQIVSPKCVILYSLHTEDVLALEKVWKIFTCKKYFTRTFLLTITINCKYFFVPKMDQHKVLPSSLLLLFIWILPTV